MGWDCVSRHVTLDMALRRSFCVHSFSELLWDERRRRGNMPFSALPAVRPHFGGYSGSQGSVGTRALNRHSLLCIFDGWTARTHWRSKLSSLTELIADSRFRIGCSPGMAGSVIDGILPGTAWSFLRVRPCSPA
jgi:hypothetical protein